MIVADDIVDHNVTSPSGTRGSLGSGLKLSDRNARTDHGRQQGGRNSDGHQCRALKKVAEPVVGVAIQRVIQGAEEQPLLLRRIQLSQIIETIRTEAIGRTALSRFQRFSRLLAIFIGTLFFRLERLPRFLPVLDIMP